MKIEIVGYSNHPEKGYLPETISAGYARVSRRKEPISYLVDEAKGDIEKSRKSNSTIIYGFGHNSIAEHITFNLVFEKVSRLMSLIIMEHRLNSYIEKSQRYIEIDSGFVTPKEIINAGLKDVYENTCNELFKAYASLFEKLKKHVQEKHPDWKPILIENTAKEDARFILPTSTYTQFGMTMNARNYEYLLMRLVSQELEEGKEVGQKLIDLGTELTPSVIKYTDPNDYFTQVYKNIKSKINTNIETASTEAVKLLEYDKDGDDKLIAALMHSTTNLSYKAIMDKIREMSDENKKDIICTAMQNLKVMDPVVREFEYVNYTFEIEMSECCYHQFIRHRMNTQSYQEMTPTLGHVIPPLIKEANLQDEFNQAIEKSNNLFKNLNGNKAAVYALTNAHKRRVLVRMNARELYHFSRIREEEYSQWEIREIAMKMSALAKEVTPLTVMLTGGRSEYKKVCQSE